jgi:ribosomal protein S18 acetylase RimI-like enzyme
MTIRPADSSDVGALARLWYEGWQDAHAAILPTALARARTLESFAERLDAALGHVRAVGPVGAPLGFCMLKGDELYQLYVAAVARGAGIAPALISDAEVRLSQSGVETAWLACAIGNERAARFYEKSGWRRTGTIVSRLDTANGPFDLEVWRYEKRLAPVERA